MLFFFGKSRFNDAVEECLRTRGAILVDVREADEYGSGHLPGAVNVPLSKIRSIRIPTDRPLYVYCLRGTRSRKAVRILEELGYSQVRSIGGITAYRGELEK